MRLLITSGLAATLMLAGCSDCGPVSGPAVPAAVAPEPGVAQLNGAARYYGEPFAGATVKAYLMGKNEVLASVTTGADGKFRLEFPASAPQGALVKLVATKNGVTAATVARVPMRQVLQADDEPEIEYVIDEQRSMVFLVLGPRLEAAGGMALGENGVVSLSIADDAFTAFTEALAAAASVPPVPREDYEGASKDAFTDDGELVRTPDAIQTIAKALPPAMAAVFTKFADKLAVVIRQAVDDGKPKPDSKLTGKLPVGGDQFADQVFGDDDDDDDDNDNDTSPSGGGGVSDPPTQDASGAVGVTDGQILDPTATPSMSLGDPP